MAVYLVQNVNFYIGLSTDTKPTGVYPGSRFYAYNTYTHYITYDDGTNWVEYKEPKLTT